MKASKNRRVFVIGYGAATPLGKTFSDTWGNAVQSKAGFRKVSRCQTTSDSFIVGEIPDWNPIEYDFSSEKEIYNWNADYVLLTMAVCKEALENAGLQMDEETGPRTACLIGSALNGTDSFRVAMDAYENKSPYKVSPYLLPILCAILPSGKAGMMLGFTGPIVSPQAACATGNYAIGIGSKMIRDGDFDFALAGGVDTCIMPEIIQGFANMRATLEITQKDRAFNDPTQASRPFSADRKGFILSEGAGVIVLASEDMLERYGLTPKAEIMGIGWNSDAHHITAPNPKTIIKAVRAAINDAELKPEDIQYINAHGTSTPIGDRTEVNCLKEIFGKKLEKIPVSANKSQLGHTLGAAAAIEAALSIEGMINGLILPTVNYIPDSELEGVDFVPNKPRKENFEIFLSNAFGFGGTNCCVVMKGV